MADFSIGGAALAGFRVVGRRPAVVFGWGLLIFVCIFVPLMLMAGSFIPLLLQMSQLAAQQGTGPKGAGGAGPPPEFWALYLRFIMLQPLLVLGAYLLRTVLTSAAIRAVLTPEDDSWFYLRLGMRELWVFLVTFVLSLILGIGLMLVFLPLLGGIGAAVYMHQYIAAGVIGGVILLIAIIAAITISLRLFMAVPMSWDLKEFRLFEAWGFTRGHTGKMFLLVLVQILIVLAFELVIGLLVAVGVFAAVGGGRFDQAHLSAMMAQPNTGIALPILAGIAVCGLIVSFVGAFMQTVLAAPWADVYRQLRDSSPPAPVYAHAPGEAPIAPPAV